jgi:hypothetical protein
MKPDHHAPRQPPGHSKGGFQGLSLDNNIPQKLQKVRKEKKKKKNQKIPKIPPTI